MRESNEARSGLQAAYSQGRSWRKMRFARRGQPFTAGSRRCITPAARFNGLTMSGFSHQVADGSSRGEKDAKAPSGIFNAAANQP